jgi:hypothetical protein
VQNEALKRFWQDWKNVIIVTVLVIINITSLTWAPIVASWFKSDPAEIERLAKYISDTMWLIVFIYAAQIIFTNRKKRLEAKKQREQEQAEAEKEAEALLAASPEDNTDSAG